ncbi:MAG: hypothetical protein M1839_006647 [Geoglossum umbratile]|nr:MAG: hypothetical protein M1839_006647 [Geoglossum umbratile]
MAPIVPHWAQPSHPNLIEVILRPKAFTSGASSLVALPAGSLFTRLETATPAPKAYSSVQISRDDHIELNSDLIYCNHSCAPSLEFDLQKFEIRVARDRDLKVGDALTFYYPSTEFEMAQPFQCDCSAGEGNCKGWIAGAGRMTKQALEGYWLNEHIEILLAEKEAMAMAENGSHHAQGLSNGKGEHTLNGSRSVENGPVEHDALNGTSNGNPHNGLTISSPELTGKLSEDTIDTVNGKSSVPSRKLGGEVGGDTEYIVNGKAGASSRELGGEMSGDTAITPSPAAQSGSSPPLPDVAVTSKQTKFSEF